MAPYQIKKFDLHSLKDNATIALIGKRRSGKSYLMRSIMKVKRHLPIGIAMSPTEKSNRFFRDYMPSSFVYYDWDTDAVTNMMERQEEIASRVDVGSDLEGLPRDPTAFIIADDCMYDKKNWRSTLVRNIFMNGRHWKLFFLFTMQYCVDIMPELRANIDYVFVFKESVKNQKTNLYKMFFGMFPTFKDFENVFDRIARNFDCIVLDTTSGNYEVENCIFWYRATEYPRFRTGGAQMWWFHHRFRQRKAVAAAASSDENEGADGGTGGGAAAAPTAASNAAAAAAASRKNSKDDAFVIKLGENEATGTKRKQKQPAAATRTKRAAPGNAAGSSQEQPQQKRVRFT